MARSRGLGDVYKRQVGGCRTSDPLLPLVSPLAGPAASAASVAVGGAVAVVACGGFGAEFAVHLAVDDVAGCPACGLAVAVWLVFGEGVAATPAACGFTDASGCCCVAGVGGVDDLAGAALMRARVVRCAHEAASSFMWGC
jgi:hypothetical protein